MKLLKFFWIIPLLFLGSCASDNEGSGGSFSNSPLAQQYLFERTDSGNTMVYANFSELKNSNWQPVLLNKTQSVKVNGSDMKNRSTTVGNQTFDYVHDIKSATSANIRLKRSNDYAFYNEVNMTPLLANFPNSFTRISATGSTTLRWEGNNCIEQEDFTIELAWQEGEKKYSRSFDIAPNTHSIKLNFDNAEIPSKDTKVMATIVRERTSDLQQVDSPATGKIVLRWIDRKELQVID